MKLESVFRYDGITGIFRLFRLEWKTDALDRLNRNYEKRLTFALSPSIFLWSKTEDEWKLILMFIRIHYKQVLVPKPNPPRKELTLEELQEEILEEVGLDCPMDEEYYL